MTFRPGRRLVIAAVGLVVLGAFSFLWPALFYAQIICLIAAVAWTWRRYLLLKRLGEFLQVERELPKIVPRRMSFESELRIDFKDQPNARAAFRRLAKQPIDIEIRDVTAAGIEPALLITRSKLSDSDSTRRHAEYHADERGKYRFGPVHIRLIDPQGWAEVHCTLPHFSQVDVYPESFASSERLVEDRKASAALMDRLRRTELRGAGTEFESLNEYREGDDVRRIDWRASVRLRHPVVRRFQIERHRDVMVLLDVGRLMGADCGGGSKLDAAVDAGLRLCRVALNSGDRCGFAVFDDELRGYLPPQSGLRAVNLLAAAVYQVQSSFRETDFGAVFQRLQSQQSKRSLLVVLSDLPDVETSVRFRRGLAELAKRHLVLFCAVQSPLVYDAFEQPIESMQQGARAALSLRLLSDRAAALHASSGGGVQVIDVLPSQITVELINRFIELRTSRRL